MKQEYIDLLKYLSEFSEFHKKQVMESKIPEPINNSEPQKFENSEVVVLFKTNEY